VAAPSREAGIELARGAVEARLAAGAQVAGPVASTFWHKGEFGTSEEWQVVLKTTADRYQELEDHIVARHEWTNPEITAVPFVTGLSPYLEWVERTTAK
jgi:periplasmic divalent cation tolerance protein